MAYNTIGFKDGSTPLDMANFNKMDEQIKANADDISQLNTDLAYKMYSQPSQIDSSLSASSTIPEIIDKMSNCSMLITRGTDIDISNMTSGSIITSVIIIRVANSRYIIIGFRGYAGVTDAQSRMFFATYDGTDMHGWFELAKADTNTTSTLNAEADKMEA